MLKLFERLALKTAALLIMTPALLLLTSASLSAEPAPVHYYVVEERASPFQITTPGSPQKGIITDIVEAVFETGDYQLKTRTLPLARLHKEIRLDEGLWITYDAKTWQSLSDVGNFVEEPLFTVTHSYLTCDAEPGVIQNAAALSGKQIAIIEGFDYPELTPLAETGTVRLESVSHYRNGIMMVSKQRVNGFVEMDLRIRYHMNQQSNLPACLRLVDMSTVIPAFDIYLQAAKLSPDAFQQFVKNRLETLKKEGRLLEIFQSYL